MLKQVIKLIFTCYIIYQIIEDEEDLENVNDDTYLKKETEYNIKCVYNYKYKQWTPIELSNERIINKNNIMFLEK